MNSAVLESESPILQVTSDSSIDRSAFGFWRSVRKNALNWLLDRMEPIEQVTRPSREYTAEPELGAPLLEFQELHVTATTATSNTAQQLLCLGGWLLLILAVYVWTRLLCYVGLPYDGTTAADPIDTFDDLTKLLQAGFLLGWFVRIMDRTRFCWLFSWKRWYFFAVLAGFSPVYGAASNLPALQFDISGWRHWGPAMTAVVLTGLVLAMSTVWWHMQAAFCSRKREEAVLYFASRAIIFLLYWVALEYLRKASAYHSVHMHHLYLGWSIALFAEFNHWVSALTLAAGLGLFIQGVGAYSFADMFNDPDCFSTIPLTGLQCAFNATSPFTLRICPGVHGAVPAHECWVT